MPKSLADIYHAVILRHPLITLLLVAMATFGIGYFAKDFRLDASADSLVLEGDDDLRYYRETRKTYGSDDFLIITYTPHGDLFTGETLTDLRLLHDRLTSLAWVAEVFSILDAPLISSPPLSFSELQARVRTLQDRDVDLEMARREFLTSPLYKELLVSPDARTTALQVTLVQDERYRDLLNRRNTLREKQRADGLTTAESQELERVSAAYRERSAWLSDQHGEVIDRIRAIMDRHRDTASLYLGGVPMIAADMIDFIRHDLVTFGIAVLLFLVGMLYLIFRRKRWVVLPLLVCTGTVFFMFGFLGLVDWPVTVVSSNFTSLLLIISLSLTIHLIVRYTEVYEQTPAADQQSLVREMVVSKFSPSLYTTLTTIVAFASLMVSDIRPVIDFGWMMAIGLAIAFVFSFLLFPAALVLFKPIRFRPKLDLTGVITRRCAHWIEDHSRMTLAIYAGLTVLAIFGISRLTVENRFIDNFKETTEIYQGMELIDRQLGGTVPLEVIVEAPQQRAADAPAAEPFEDPFEDPFDDPFDEPGAVGDSSEAGLTAASYWFNTYRLETVYAIHDYLDALPESGKVLSLATTMRMLRQLNEGRPLDDVLLSVIHKKLPPEVDEALFAPYLSADGDQLRFTLRVYETDPDLRRNQLINQVRHDLKRDFGLDPEQVRLTGMLVLYNNVLQSLFDSQIKTIGMVFLAIMVMFLILFRSLRLAILAIIPNLVSAALVLGIMGWLGIPLDIMTITIAAITIGIAVDDTIHYVHRYSVEVAKDLDHVAAMQRTHDSVGRAMFYTSVVIIVGFSILALSRFIPSIYFGLFTGLAMAVAMLANLTLLAILLMRVQPKKVCWLPKRRRDVAPVD